MTSTATQPDRLLGTREVARKFSVTERTVINWVRAGKLEAVRTLGGHYRFRPEDIEPLVAPKAPR